jgi:hypothetical protein
MSRWPGRLSPEREALAEPGSGRKDRLALAWSSRRARLREGAVLWLMRAGMLGYALAFILLAEAALRRLLRAF